MTRYEKAYRIYQEFHKRNPRKIRRVRLPLPRGYIVDLGKIRDLVYRWSHDGRQYIHKFKGSRLYTNEDGTILLIDNVKITGRGIE